MFCPAPSRYALKESSGDATEQAQDFIEEWSLSTTSAPYCRPPIGSYALCVPALYVLPKFARHSARVRQAARVAFPRTRTAHEAQDEEPRFFEHFRGKRNERFVYLANVHEYGARDQLCSMLCRMLCSMLCSMLCRTCFCSGIACCVACSVTVHCMLFGGT